MRQLALFVGALVFGAFSGGVSVAGVGSLPAANGFVQCLTKSGFITNPTSCNGGADSGTVTYSPDASLQAKAFGEGLTDAANTFGVLNYSFEVIGGHAGDVVPIDIDTVLRAISISNNPLVIGYAFAEIGIAADTSANITICTEVCGSGTGVTHVSDTLTVDAVSGVVYTNGVHLEVEAGGARGDASDFNGGVASVDPHFFVEPTFIDAGDYQILLSDGIGNAIPSAVPEPTAWALLLLGVGAIGASARVARRKVSLAVAV
jgi:hypothetical protein